MTVNFLPRHRSRRNGAYLLDKELTDIDPLSHLVLSQGHSGDGDADQLRLLLEPRETCFVLLQSLCAWIIAEDCGQS